MFNPTESDFEEIKSWGLDQDPFKAIKDFSPEKIENRWENSYHKEAHQSYYDRRAQWIEKKNFDHYYKKAEKPIGYNAWNYLKERKAWYIMPLGWDLYAEPGVTKVLDLGCGDGDVTQRVADYIVKKWEEKGYEGHDLTIVGLDLNASRIENAKLHCRSSHEKIKFEFAACDVVGDGIPYADQAFDHTTCTGVLEILEDKPAKAFVKELCRVTRDSVHIEDLADEYPGGYPRENFDMMFEPCGFKIEQNFTVLTEPFCEKGTKDPMKLWPNLKDTNLLARRINK
ncbi:MAG: class I SAM-dependent methyltransferase [Oligoflexales bacterium]